VTSELESLIRDGAAEPEDALARLFVRVDARDEAALRRALDRLSDQPESPRREALAGRVLIELGLPEEAAARLARAGGEAAAARAEALLLCGRAREALESLAGAEGPTAAALLAAARLALGDARGARREASAAAAVPVGAAAAALAARALDDADEAERLFAETIRLRPGRAWPHALLAAARAAAGDLGGARLELAEALRLEPASAWLSEEAARLEERLGVIPAALAHVERALELEATLSRRLLRASLLDRWREHEEAAEEYARALALAPGDAEIAWARAKAFSAANLLDRAFAAGGEAWALAPESAEIGAWTARVAIAAGRAAQARRIAAVLSARLGRRPETPPILAYLRGYEALRARRWRAAETAFLQAAKLGRGAAIERRAKFYACAARILAVAGPRRRVGMLFNGLGVDPPYSATADDVRTLAGGTILFNNVMGDEMFEFLRALCKDVRAGAYHQDNDEERIASVILPAIPRGGSAAWVTRGNAIIYGPLGALLLKRRREAKAPWVCLPGVASLEFFHARFGRGAVPSGLVCVDVREPARGTRLEPTAANAVFWDLSIGEAAQRDACRGIVEAIGPDGDCLVFDHVVAQEPIVRRAKDLDGVRDRLSPSAIIVTLPRRSR